MIAEIKNHIFNNPLLLAGLITNIILLILANTIAKSTYKNTQITSNIIISWTIVVILGINGIVYYKESYLAGNHQPAK